MPTSQNNKYKNMLIAKDKTIAELEEKVLQCDDTEVNKLKGQIILLRKQNDENNKKLNDLNNECKSLNSIRVRATNKIKERGAVARECMRTLLILQEVLLNACDNKTVVIEGNELSDNEKETYDELRCYALHNQQEEITRQSMSIIKRIVNPDFEYGVGSYYQLNECPYLMKT